MTEVWLVWEASSRGSEPSNGIGEWQEEMGMPAVEGLQSLFLISEWDKVILYIQLKSGCKLEPSSELSTKCLYFFSENLQLKLFFLVWHQDFGIRKRFPHYTNVQPCLRTSALYL